MQAICFNSIDEQQVAVASNRKVNLREMGLSDFVHCRKLFCIVEVFTFTAA